LGLSTKRIRQHAARINSDSRLQKDIWGDASADIRGDRWAAKKRRQIAQPADNFSHRFIRIEMTAVTSAARRVFAALPTSRIGPIFLPRGKTRGKGRNGLFGGGFSWEEVRNRQWLFSSSAEPGFHRHPRHYTFDRARRGTGRVP